MLSIQPLPPLQPSVELQKTLSNVVYSQQYAVLVAGDIRLESRLSSLSTPHEMDWTCGVSRWFQLDTKQVGAALRWVLGVPLRDGMYRCPDCNFNADQMGHHAVACVKAGGHIYGHNAVRDTLLQVAAAAGFTVERERAIPSDASLRPADLLVHAWQAGSPSPLMLQ